MYRWAVILFMWTALIYTTNSTSFSNFFVLYQLPVVAFSAYYNALAQISDTVLLFFPESTTIAALPNVTIAAPPMAASGSSVIKRFCTYCNWAPLRMQKCVGVGN